MFTREGAHVYLWLIHADVWQNPSQYCKVITLQLRKKKESPTKGNTSESKSKHLAGLFFKIADVKSSEKHQKPIS